MNRPEGPAPQPPAAPAPQYVPVRLERARPVVVWAILGVTTLVYLLQISSPYLWGYDDLPALLGMKINAEIARGAYWRLLTPMLLHGGILHLGFNMYALYNLGPGLERHYGHWRFLALYVLSGFAGNVMSFLFSSSASLGASTAIFGLLAAEGVFLYENRQIFGAQARQALGTVLTFAAINLMFGFTVPNIDNFGHIGGMLGGILFAWGAGPVLAVEGIYPNLRLVDARGQGEIWRAALSVGLFFILLTAATIWIRR